MRLALELVRPRPRFELCDELRSRAAVPRTRDELGVRMIWADTDGGGGGCVERADARVEVVAPIVGSVVVVPLAAAAVRAVAVATLVAAVVDLVLATFVLSEFAADALTGAAPGAARARAAAVPA